MQAVLKKMLAGHVESRKILGQSAPREDESGFVSLGSCQAPGYSYMCLLIVTRGNNIVQQRGLNRPVDEVLDQQINPTRYDSTRVMHPL